MAFLATGNTDDGGRYAANIRRALDFLTRESTVPGGDTEDQAIFALRCAGHMAWSPMKRCGNGSKRPPGTL